MWPFRNRRLNRAYLLGRIRSERRHQRELERLNIHFDNLLREHRAVQVLLQQSMDLTDALRGINGQLIVELEVCRHQHTHEPAPRTLH